MSSLSISSNLSLHFSFLNKHSFPHTKSKEREWEEKRRVRKRGRGHEGGTEKGTAITARQDTSISQSVFLTQSEWTHTAKNSYASENTRNESTDQSRTARKNVFRILEILELLNKEFQKKEEQKTKSACWVRQRQQEKEDYWTLSIGWVGGAEGLIRCMWDWPIRGHSIPMLGIHWSVWLLI